MAGSKKTSQPAKPTTDNSGLVPPVERSPKYDAGQQATAAALTEEERKKQVAAGTTKALGDYSSGALLTG